MQSSKEKKSFPDLISKWLVFSVTWYDVSTKCANLGPPVCNLLVNCKGSVKTCKMVILKIVMCQVYVFCLKAKILLHLVIKIL